MLIKQLKAKLFEHLAKRHPCLNEEAHFQYGRIHLPVSPECNIQCRFCRRSFNKCEERPGVSRGLLTPEAAVAKVTQALQLCPELTVVGIAGPEIRWRRIMPWTYLNRYIVNIQS